MAFGSVHLNYCCAINTTGLNCGGWEIIYIYEKLQGYDLFALAHKDLISWVKCPEHSSCVKIIVETMLREMFLMVISQSFDGVFEGNAFPGVQVQSSCGGPWVSTALRKRCRKEEEASDHSRVSPSTIRTAVPRVLRMPHTFLVKAALITTRKTVAFLQNLAEVRSRRSCK